MNTHSVLFRNENAVHGHDVILSERHNALSLVLTVHFQYRFSLACFPCGTNESRLFACSSGRWGEWIGGGHWKSMEYGWMVSSEWQEGSDRMGGWVDWSVDSVYSRCQ